jgi:hypothetical protein
VRRAGQRSDDDDVRLEAEPPAVRHGVTGVEREVEQRVLEQPRVAEDERRLRPQDSLDADAFVDAVRQDVGDLAQQRVHVDRYAPELPLAGERQKLSRELGGTPGAVKDVRHVAPVLFVVELALEQVGVADDGGELIVEIVGHAPRELADGFELLRLSQALLKQASRRHVLEDRHELVWLLAFVAYERERDVHPHHAAVPTPAARLACERRATAFAQFLQA